jgi:Kelch motif
MRRLAWTLLLFIVFASVLATAQIADVFRVPLAGGWPQGSVAQGFGRASDNPPFNVDTGWWGSWYGYHLAYDVGVTYSNSDLQQKKYKQVLAPANGVVRFAQVVVGYTVVIEHQLPAGDPDGPYVCSVFYHMLRPTDGGVRLAVGQVVNINDVVGFVSPFKVDHGSSPHQHYGIRRGAFRSGRDPRTGYWFYPGYTTIKGEKDPKDVIHRTVISEWFNPSLFLQRHKGGPIAGFTATNGYQSTFEGQILSAFTTGNTASIAFSASRSYDPGGVITGWNWLVDGVLASAAPTFTAPIGIGTHAVTLRVSDSNGAKSALVTGTVNVKDYPAYSFVSLGNLVINRDGPTATLLQDGTVLIAGGTDGVNALASAELFDPSTDTFTLLSSQMSTPRWNHSATLMGNGEVLIEGGYNHLPQGSDSALGTAEIYDPTTRTFSSPIAMLNNHSYNEYEDTLLSSGQVFLPGGETGWTQSNCYTVLSSAQLFDPVHQTFSYTSGTLNPGRQAFRSVMLGNGKVVLFGGFPPPCGLLSTLEIYDPVSQSFTQSSSQMSVPREAHTATLLQDGTVLIAGGFSGYSAAELYIPASDSFVPVGSMETIRFHHSATLLGNGLVLMAGGYVNGNYDPTASAELFDPASRSFPPSLLNMTTARAAHRAVKLNDGRVLIVGGGTAEILE